MVGSPHAGPIWLGENNEELPGSWLESRGGFLWWYLDLLDRDGNGVVLIWSFGLPFLPGYKSAASRGLAPRAYSRPSINCSFYAGGKQVFYGLEEYRKDESSWAGGQWKFGDSTLSSYTLSGKRFVEAKLQMRIPGGGEEKAHIHVRAEGPTFRLPLDRKPFTFAPSPHNWIPWSAVAQGDATLSVGSSQLRTICSLQGRVYHDRNGSTVPLHELGIHHWIWGRFPFRAEGSLRDSERIFYLLWPQDKNRDPVLIAFEVDELGNASFVNHLRVERQAVRIDTFGMPYWKQLRLYQGQKMWMQVNTTHFYESGPFYLRAVANGQQGNGKKTLGTVELCRPGRVDKGWQRPLVRMRVQPSKASGSIWSPLFMGPREDRIARLLQRNLPNLRRL